MAMVNAVSEGAEVIDAAYNALPLEVRRRWGADRPKQMIDQFGQYGIDGADWKGQAVFHNLHKIDLEQFGKNLLSNYLEDKAIGGLHSKLPRNFGNAAEDGQKAFAELVNKGLEAIGL